VATLRGSPQPSRCQFRVQEVPSDCVATTERPGRGSGAGRPCDRSQSVTRSAGRQVPASTGSHNVIMLFYMALRADPSSATPRHGTWRDRMPETSHIPRGAGSRKTSAPPDTSTRAWPDPSSIGSKQVAASRAGRRLGEDGSAIKRLGDCCRSWSRLERHGVGELARSRGFHFSA
jgi:hypothetical protein